MPKSDDDKKFSWGSAHTIITVIASVVALTIGSITYFATAADFNQFKTDVYIYQLEERAGKITDRIIELNKDINKTGCSEAVKLQKIGERTKLEYQLGLINKKIDYYMAGGKPDKIQQHVAEQAPRMADPAPGAPVNPGVR